MRCRICDRKITKEQSDRNFGKCSSCKKITKSIADSLRLPHKKSKRA